MVASPNVTFGKAAPFVNQARQQQHQTDELGRASSYPLSVSAAGSPVFTAAPNPSGAGAVVSTYDGAGNLVCGTDPDSGYGLAYPKLPIPGYPLDPSAVPSTTASTFTVTWAGIWNASNPGFLGSINLKLVGGTACEVMWHLYRYDGSGFTVLSSVAAFSGAGLYTDVYRGYLLPAANIGHDMVVEVQARVSAGSGTVYAQPIAATGTSAAVVRSNNFW